MIIHKQFRKTGWILWVALAAAIAPWAQRIPDRPSPPRLVNDFTQKVLTSIQVQHLEDKLVAFDDSTSNQIAIVILPNLQSRDIADFAFKLGREWGVGRKGKNNGVVILLNMEEGNRKVFIAPGYGLEGALPDIVCKRIIENEMLPYFREGNYYRGLEKAVDAIMLATKGEYSAEPAGEGGVAGWIIVILIILFIVFLVGLGSHGSGGGDAMTRRGHRHMNTPPFIFFPGGGGHGGGGGFSGGGFGGFGGGSFGGGGAGGSW